MVPAVAGVSVSGTIIFASISVAGEVMMTAVSMWRSSTWAIRT